MRTTRSTWALTLSEKDAACLEKDVCEFGERVHGFTLANIYKVVLIGKFVGMCFEVLPNTRVIPILLETWDYWNPENLQFVLRYQLVSGPSSRSPSAKTTTNLHPSILRGRPERGAEH